MNGVGRERAPKQQGEEEPTSEASKGPLSCLPGLALPASIHLNKLWAPRLSQQVLKVRSAPLRVS